MNVSLAVTGDAIVDDIAKEGGVLDQYAAEIRQSWIADRALREPDGEFTTQDASQDAVQNLGEEFDAEIEALRTFLKMRQAGINGAIGTQLADVCVAVSFIVDGNVVKTTEIRRGETLDTCDYPPDPEKDGLYFLGWECEGSDEAGIASRYFTEDCNVHAVFIPDEEATRPSGLFFRFADAWASTNTTLMSTGVIFAPENVVDGRLTWTSSDPSIADIVSSSGSQLIKVKKKVGATVFTCTSSNGVTASFTLRVYDPNETSAGGIEDFQLKSDRLELKVGQFGQVPVKVSPQPFRGILFYESSDGGIAAVYKSDAGVIEGIAPGTYTCATRIPNAIPKK